MNLPGRQEITLNNGHAGFRALLGAEVRVLSESKGEVEYIASDETIDSYREVIRVSGWRFDLFSRNAPFVDSHDYSSIGKLLGNVVDWRVDRRKRQLIETVRWAKDVAGNTVAQLGWEMLRQGFGPKAVSVGFYPVKSVTGGDGVAWHQQLKELGLTGEARVQRIFTEQQQIELSACILGANPNAVQAAQKALAAGVISRREFTFLQSGATSPQFQIPAPETEPKTDMKPKLLSILDKLTGTSPNQPSESLETRDDPAGAGMVQPGELQTLSLRTLCELTLDATPRLREWLGAVSKQLLGREKFLTDGETKIVRALNTGTGAGATLVPEDIAVAVFNLMSLYGAWRTLGVVPLAKSKTRVAQVTGEGTALWMGRTVEGTAITPATITGGGSDADCRTLAGLVEVSQQLVEDGRATFEGALLEALVNALNKGADHACFMADGTDDVTDGAQTGIFQHGSVPVVAAAAGNVSIATLDLADFVNTIAGVSASALQRPCRWWINPAFLPKLMVLKDGDEYILKQPTIPGGEWMLAGFPVTWIAVGPGVDAANSKIAAFGRGESFMFALQRDFKLESSSLGSGYNKMMVLFRAVMRAHALMRDAASFAILRTATV